MSYRGQTVALAGASAPPQIILLFPGYLYDSTHATATWLPILEAVTLAGLTVQVTLAGVDTAGVSVLTLKRSADDGATFVSVAVLTVDLTLHTQTLTPTWLVPSLDPGDLLSVGISGTTGTGWGCTVLLAQVGA